TDGKGIEVFKARLLRLISQIPATQVLLETHDGSLADDPALLVRLVEELALPKLGLLFQPTVFNAESARKQFQIQRPFIRQIHLQNRNPDLSFATLRDGVISWNQILEQLGGEADATLEFVPAGICNVEQFDLAKTLRQARTEADYVCGITGKSR